LGHRQREGQAIYNLAVVTTIAGQPGQAYSWFQDALTIAREQRNYVEVLKCLNALGVVCGHLGKKEEALSHSFQSLRLAEELGNARAQSSALDNIGALLQATDEAKRGLTYLEKAVQIDLQTGAPGGAAQTMSFLAAAYVSHDIGRAYDLAKQSIAIAREIEDPSLLAASLGALGSVLVERNEPGAATKALTEALDLAKKTGMRHEEGNILFAMGLLLDNTGEHEAAFSKFEDALNIFEEHYSELEFEDFRLSYFNAFTIQNLYLIYTSRLLRHSERTGDKSYGVRAFHVCERRHARGLREFLHARLEHNAGPDLAPEADWGLVNPPSLAQIQEKVLDADTALLEYSLHDRVSYVWVLTRDDHALVSLPLGGREIRERVDELRSALIAGSDSYLSLARALYQSLVQPVSSWIQGKRNLLIVPDLALHLLPFQVLLSDHYNSPHSPSKDYETTRSRLLSRFIGRRSLDFSTLPYMLRTHAITYAPSAAIFAALGAHTQKLSEPRDLIAFAPVEFAVSKKDGTRLEALPETVHEVRKIAALFNPARSVVKTFGEATKRALFSERLTDYRFIHFATHALFNDTDPDSSAIVLHGDAQADDALRTEEVVNLKMEADLIVLSACETGLGTVKYGEGILGFVRAFFCAGARSVCASLWKVDDVATSRLMSKFYEGLVRNGLSKAEALRTSQLDLIDSGRWSSPRFWAAFVLTGGWR
jgi:CHAT domain-containing protein